MDLLEFSSTACFFFQPTKSPNVVQVWFSENYGLETSSKRLAKKVFREAFSPQGSFSLLELGWGKSVAFQKPDQPPAEWEWEDTSPLMIYFSFRGLLHFGIPLFFKLCAEFLHKIEMLLGLFSQCPMYCRLVQVGNYDGMWMYKQTWFLVRTLIELDICQTSQISKNLLGK